MANADLEQKIRVALGQVSTFDEETFRWAAQLGLKHCQFNTPELPGEKWWEYEDLLALRLKCEAFGIRLDVIENVQRKFMDQILTGGPGRDEQIENYRRTISNMGKAGIHILGFHFMPNSTWRTSGTTPGRGGALVTSYDQALAEQGKNIKPPLNPPLHYFENREEKVWGNYEYFIKAVIPVAEEAGVKLALHVDDPPVREVGGSARIFYNIANVKRGMNLVKSDHLGLNMCLGTFSSMAGGAGNVEETIRELGPADKIFYVHFRDVQGSVPCFQECFLGEGNFRPGQILRQLKQSGFRGLLFDDHVPEIVNDTPYGHRARSYAIGYLQGLLEMMDEVN